MAETGEAPMARGRGCENTPRPRPLNRPGLAAGRIPACITHLVSQELMTRLLQAEARSWKEAAGELRSLPSRGSPI